MIQPVKVYSYKSFNNYHSHKHIQYIQLERMLTFGDLSILLRTDLKFNFYFKLAIRTAFKMHDFLIEAL